MTDSPMPSPPFPSPDNAALQVVVGNAIAAVDSGEATVKEAILHAAVHGWYEGHIQGEDECPGCDFRGGLPKNTNRGGPSCNAEERHQPLRTTHLGRCNRCGWPTRNHDTVNPQATVAPGWVTVDGSRSGSSAG